MGFVDAGVQTGALSAQWRGIASSIEGDVAKQVENTVLLNVKWQSNSTICEMDWSIYYPTVWITMQYMFVWLKLKCHTRILDV